MDDPMMSSPLEQGVVERRLTLTDEERRVLAEPRWLLESHQALAELFAPFQQAFLQYAVRNCQARYHHYTLRRALHFCGKLMLEFDCTYWAFEWERLRDWKRALLEQEKDRSKIWHGQQADNWQLVTSTLFFLGVIPYSEEIYQTYHRVLAEKWLGKERAREIAEQFMQAALSAGYQDKVTLHKCVTSALLSILVLARKTELAALTMADLENWRHQTQRSPRVANASLVRIEKVLRAMGHLPDAALGQSATEPPSHFTWGHTASAIVQTFERFLADLHAVRVAGTVNSYRVALRRFGDWGSLIPAVKAPICSGYPQLLRANCR